MGDSTKIKADLVPYTTEYSQTIRSWIESEETYRLVCRGVNFPPPDDVVDSWQRKGVSSFLLITDSKPVAYGELWERKAERAVELSHIIVDTYQRGSGYGTKLVQLLFNRASQRYGVAKVMVSLYNDSVEALDCFTRAGFELTGTATHIEGLKLERPTR